MKKLILIIEMLMSVGFIINTYADDLSNMDSALQNLDAQNSNNADAQNSNNSGSQDLGLLDSSSTEDANSSSTEDANSSSTEDAKIVLSTTGEVAPDSVNLTFKKLAAYSEYKIYYSKTSENDNLLEKEVSAEDAQEDVNVTVDNLETNTEYQFVVKAFDNDGNPIESTSSDSLDVSTTQAHNAASDNIIHNPVIKVEGTKVTISYKPGVDVKKVQISLSEDGQIFKPLTTIDATQTSYSFVANTTGKKYIKIVPIAEDGTVGLCKVGETNINNTFTANVEPQKNTQKNMGKPKTGPEMYLLIILSIFAYIAYSIRKRA